MNAHNLKAARRWLQTIFYHDAAVTSGGQPPLNGSGNDNNDEDNQNDTEYNQCISNQI